MPAGLSICRDFRGVEESYILISGEEVRMERGFVSLTSLDVLTGYKFQAKNMIAMGVQVLVTFTKQDSIYKERIAVASDGRRFQKP